MHIGFPDTSGLFVGRDKELADITARLTDPNCRLLTLTGLGGSGKTRLALEAGKIADRSYDAVFVALQPLTRSDLLVPTIAQALNLSFYGGIDPKEQLFSYLADKTLLLILDNFEHVLDGAVLVSDILAAAPGITVLATSREALNLREEWLYPLHGLSRPSSVYTTELYDYEAVRLFIAHAQRIQPAFDLAQEREAIIRICEMTAGLPLALELASTWLKGLSAAQIAQELQRNLSFLSTTTRNIEPRHRSMRAVFDQSWSLLSDNERQIFARLAVFAGGFDAQAASQIAGASMIDLAGLVEKSLLHREGADRFGIHALLHQYATEQLEAHGEREIYLAQHSHYYAQQVLAYENALQQTQQREAVQAIERDFDNIRQAWDWSVRNGQNEQLHMLLGGLYLFGFLRSRYRETLGLFQECLEQFVEDRALYGRLLARCWGYLHFGYQVDYQEALAGIEQALTIAQEQNDHFEIAFCQLMAAYALFWFKRSTDALPYLEASKSQFEQLDKPYYVCWVLHRLGYAFYDLNDITKANDFTEQSLTIARRTHDRVAWTTCLYNLGSGYIVSGEYIKAQQYCAEALAIATETGHQYQIAHALCSLGLIALCQGDYATSYQYTQRSHQMTEEVKLLAFLPYSIAPLIILACLREDYAEAISLAEAGNIASVNNMGLQLYTWALIVLTCSIGHTAEARKHYDDLLQQSNLAMEPAIGMWLLPCAAAILAESEPQRSVELLAWILSNNDPALHWARQWPHLKQVQDQLRNALANDIYQRCWEHGVSLSPDSAMLYVQYAYQPTIPLAAPEHQLLTSREREILTMMATGMTNPAIAARLVIGAGTVKTHTLNIYRKLEVANRTQAIRRAQELGLLRSAALPPQSTNESSIW